MQIDKKKLEEQEQIIEIWLDGKAKGTVVAPTGFGKSFIAVLAIQKMNLRHLDRTTLIIVPTKSLKTQWEKLVSKFNLLNVKIEVINTAIKTIGNCHLLVLDEIHRYAADTFKKVFQYKKYNFILGLTATFSRQDMKHYIIERFCPVIFEMTLKEAQSKKYVSNFEIYNLATELNLTDRANYEELERKFNYYFAWFEHDFHRAKLCSTDMEYINYYANKMGVDPGEVRVKAINFFRMMQKRKAFLYENSSKLSVIKAILLKYPVKTIVFSETIRFAEYVSEMMGDICAIAHTKIPERQREKIVEEFSDPFSNIRILSTSKMYDEGIDVPAIEMAVIASGTSTKRQNIQRVGRAVRKNGDKKAKIFNIYIEESQERKWVEKRTQGLNPIWIKNLDEVENGVALDIYSGAGLYLI